MRELVRLLRVWGLLLMICSDFSHSGASFPDYGCCYNGMVFKWGSVVEELPEMCMQLMCAAVHASPGNDLTAAIVPVKLQSHFCKGFASCGDCLNYYCVDDTGLVQAEGAMWSPDECHTCVCNGSEVSCSKTPESCPLPPNKFCVENPGRCCPQWNCSFGCIDDAGEHHELGSSWHSTPCTYHTCTQNGMITLIEDCFLPPPVHHSCTEITQENECCPRWHCSGCTDAAGNYHELCHEWTDSDPCLVFTCTPHGISEKLLVCEKQDQPHAGCYNYTSPGECCPKWNCSGCVDQSGYHPLLSKWTSDFCTTHSCTWNGIQTTREDCELEPAPHHTCLQYTPPQQCCPQWKCRGCFDKSGDLHEIGHTWSTEDPCLLLKCTDEGITFERVLCTDLRPHPTCTEYIPVGECCRKWNCSSCVDNGKSRRLYEFWKSDSCTTNFCTKNGTQTIRETCKKTDAPHPSCQKILPEGECCPDWRCRGCFDASGNYHEIDDEWSMKDPCLMFLCSDEGIIMKLLKCTRTPSLYPHCYEYKAQGECCPRWNCSGCIDDTGEHPLYDTWKTDSCTTHVCTRDGVQVLKETCTLGPAPHPSCLRETPEDSCCAEWKCRSCQGNEGNRHEEGDSWIDFKNSCMNCSCTEGNVNCVKIDCGPLPERECDPHKLPGECCPRCHPLESKITLDGCVDHAGMMHKFGERWVDPVNACIEYLCGRLGFIQQFKLC